MVHKKGKNRLYLLRLVLLAGASLLLCFELVISIKDFTPKDVLATVGTLTITGGATYSTVATTTLTTTNLTLGGVAVTATGTELNYIHGVTSAIQGQVDAKAPLTGVGTSGTWPIGISGNAATATTATNQNGGTVTATDGYFGGKIAIHIPSNATYSGPGFTNNGIVFYSGGSPWYDSPGAMITYTQQGSFGADIQFVTRPGAGTNAVEVMRATSTGNLGIGTTAPGYKLDVVGDVQANGTTGLRLTGNAAGITFTGTGVDKITTAASQHLALMPGGNVGVGTTAPAGLLDVNGKLTVLAAGNVGIGITNPAALLAVSGSAASNGGVNITSTNTNAGGFGGFIAYNSGGGYIGMSANGTSTTGSPFGIVRSTPTALIDSTLTTILGTDTANPLIFGTNNSERARIDQNGNVGIGTTGPAYKLDVVGDIQANGTTGLRLTGAGADIAFTGTGPNIITTASGVNLALMPGGTGNVGIGTSTPGTTLDINGTVRMNSNVYQSGGTINSSNLGDVVNLNKNLGPDVAGSWSSGTAGTARWAQDAALYNGKIYYWGGSNGSALNTVDIYNIASNSWSSGTAGGTARVYPSGALYNGKIYHWGGQNSGGTYINTMDIYDINANSWSTGAAGGTGRTFASTALYNGKIYYIGGVTSVGVANTVDIYDINANSWSTGTAGGALRTDPSNVLYNGYVYIWGGTVAGTWVNTMDIYNISTGVWTAGVAGGTARADHDSVLYNGKMYSFGGYNGSNLNSVDIYDIPSGAWTTGTTGGTARYYNSVVVYNGKVYSFGGNPNGANMDIYDMGDRQNILSLQENGQDTLNFTTNSTLFANSGKFAIMGGNVGIGMATPSAQLSVMGFANFYVGQYGMVGAATPAGTAGLSFYTNDVNQYRADIRRAATSMDFAIGPAFGAPSVKMSLADTGNLGIGTTTPYYPFQLSGTTAATATNSTVYTGAAGAGVGAIVRADSSSIPTAAGQRIAAFAGGYFRPATNASIGAGVMNVYSDVGAWTDGSSYPSAIGFNTIPSGSTSNAERMRIDSNGNVGIGTSAPNYKLDVNGSIGLPSNGGGSTNRIYLSGTDANHYIYSSGTSGNAMYLGEYGGVFHLVNTNGGADVVTVTGGNVGIGTTAPANALDVNGTIGALHSTGTAQFAMDTGNSGSNTLTNATTYTPYGTTNIFAGFFLVQNITNGHTAFFITGGNAITLVAQTNTTFTTTSGTASKTNVYLDPTNHYVIVQNNTGGTVTYQTTMFRTRTLN